MYLDRLCYVVFLQDMIICRTKLHTSLQHKKNGLIYQSIRQVKTNNLFTEVKNGRILIIFITELYDG